MSLDRKVVKRKLRESVPKHIEAVQIILAEIGTDYIEGNEQAQETSATCLMLFEALETIKETIDHMEKQI